MKRGKYNRVKLGGSVRIWDNKTVAVFFARSFDGTAGYDVGNYNSVAKDWNHYGYRFATLSEAKSTALALQAKIGK